MVQICGNNSQENYLMHYRLKISYRWPWTQTSNICSIEIKRCQRGTVDRQMRHSTFKDQRSIIEKKIFDQISNCTFVADKLQQMLVPRLFSYTQPHIDCVCTTVQQSINRSGVAIHLLQGGHNCAEGWSDRRQSAIDAVSRHLNQLHSTGVDRQTAAATWRTHLVPWRTGILQLILQRHSTKSSRWVPGWRGFFDWLFAPAKIAKTDWHAQVL